MKMKSISLAAAFALASTAALAQGNTVGGNSHSGGPAPKRADDNLNDSTATGGAAMKNGAAGTTTGSSRLSPKDAGAVDKNGDATSPRWNHEEVTSRQERFCFGKIMQVSLDTR